ncbi:HAD family acid phosphatase [uncultured Shewanella sp.]|uniref:HAD family acid phosphatase n=1 Tax=uncultured Shewanella sp. TaxID=173975 RepID=UPI00262BE682|nr:HAD family acid phosphatase [uncultured Shewanella sp.]
MKFMCPAFLSLSFVFISINLGAVTPENSHDSIAALVEYHDSGQYLYELTMVVEKAEKNLREQIEQKYSISKKLAVVFDVDETMVSNYDNIYQYLSDFSLNMGLLHDGKTITMSYNNKIAPRVIPPILRLYNSVKNHGITIFIITGDQDTYRKFATEKLMRLGYSGWKTLYMKPSDYDKPSVIPYKSKIRQQIFDKGYRILFSIGDQYSDLLGGYADKIYKLPNPYYFIP